MLCPRCGHENIQGSDRCENCLEPFRDRDVPQASEGFQQLLMEQAIKSLGSHLQVRISPSATVAEAVRLMKRNRTGCVLVVSDSVLAGIFTERDLLLKLIGTGKDLERINISDVMTREPETVEGADSIRFALHKMSIGGFRHIPTTSEGKLEGLITAKDVLRFLARELIYNRVA